MKLLSSTVVTSTEDQDRLEFTVENEFGWVDFLVPPIAIVGCALLSWRDRTWWLMIMCAIGLLIFAFHWTRRSSSKLSVSEYEIIAIPDFKRFPNRATSYKTHAVRKLQFFVGDDDSPSGLYVNDDCVIPDISNEKSAEITNLIFARFRNIGVPDATKASLLHGDDSGITSLGLLR